MKLISSSLSRGTVALVAFVLLASATVAGYGYLYVGAMISNPDSPDVAISKAFQAETVRVQLAFTESGDGTVSPVMFPGLRYVPGSVSGNGGGGITVTETNASTTAPEFAITGVDAGDNLIISFDVLAICDIPTGTAGINVTVDNGGVSNTGTINVNVVQAQLTATNVHAPEPYDRGGAETVTFDVINGGVGSVDEVRIEIEENNVTTTTSIEVGGQTFLPDPSSTATTSVFFVTAAGLPGGSLDQNETITVTRNVEIADCVPGGVGTNFQDFNNTYGVTFQDDGGGSCQPLSTVNGQFTFNAASNGSPGPTNMIGTITAADGCTAGVIPVTVTNNNTGNVEFGDGLNLALTVRNIVGGMTDFTQGGVIVTAVELSNGTALTFTGGGQGGDFSQLVIDLDGQAALITPQPGLTDEDADDFFDDLAPGASVTINISYEIDDASLCGDPVPSTENDLGLQTTLENICGADISFPAGNGTTPIAAGFSGGSSEIIPLSASPEVGTGQTGNIQSQVNLNYEATDLVSCPDPEFILNIPDVPGVTITAVRLDGATIPTTPNATTMATEASLATMAVMGDLLEIDFTTTPGTTPDGFMLMYNIDFVCSSACPEGRRQTACGETAGISVPNPPACTTGGATTEASLVERTTVGFSDINAQTPVDINTLPASSLKRVLPCDEVLIESQTTITAGDDFTDGDDLFYRVEYNLLGGSDRLVMYNGGTYDGPGGTTGTALGTPVFEGDVAGQHVIIYSLGSVDANDVLSVDLAATALGPAGLTNDLTQVDGFSNRFFTLASGAAPPTGSSTGVSCNQQALELYARDPQYSLGPVFGETRYFPCQPRSLVDNNRRLWIRGNEDGSDLPSRDPVQPDIDYFPGEIRPIVTLDSIVVIFPPELVYVDAATSGTDNFLFVRGGEFPPYANGNSANLNNRGRVQFDIGEPTITPDAGGGTRVTWVRTTDWPVADDYFLGSYNVTFSYEAVCNSAGGSVPLGLSYFIKDNDNGDAGCAISEEVDASFDVTIGQPGFSLTNLTPPQNGDQAQECFSLRIRPAQLGGGTIPNVYFAFPGSGLAGSVATIESFTPTAPAGAALAVETSASGQFVVVGDQPAGQTRTYEVCVSYTDCGQVAVPVEVNYDCDDAPTAADDPADPFCSANTNTTEMVINPLEGVIQVTIDQQPPVPSDLCADLVYEFSYVSTAAADVINPALDLDLPSGMTVSTIEIEYPTGSGNVETVMASGTSGMVTLDLGTHSAINDSIPGVNNAAAAADREANITLTFVTDCDFATGGVLGVTARGESPCGDVATGDGNMVATNPVVITGTDLPFFGSDVTLDFGADTIITCDAEELSVTLTLFDDQTEAGGGDLDADLDSIVINIPDGVTLDAASFTCTSPDMANCPTAPVLSQGGDRAAFGLPGVTIPENGSIDISFTIDLTAEDDGPCGVPGELAVFTQRTLPPAQCATAPGGVCPNPQLVNTGGSDTTIVGNRPSLANLLVDVTDNTGTIDFVGSVDVTDVDLPAATELTVEVFCINGGVVDASPSGTTVITTSGAAAGGTATFTGSLGVTCPDMEFQFRIANVATDGSVSCICNEVEVMAQTMVSCEPLTLLVPSLLGDGLCALDPAIMLEGLVLDVEDTITGGTFTFTTQRIDGTTNVADAPMNNVTSIDGTQFNQGDSIVVTVDFVGAGAMATNGRPACDSTFEYRLVVDNAFCGCDLSITNVDPDCTYNPADMRSRYTLDVSATADPILDGEDVDLVVDDVVVGTATIDGTGMVTFTGVSIDNTPGLDIQVDLVVQDNPACNSTRFIDLIACSGQCSDAVGSGTITGGQVFIDDDLDGTLDGDEDGLPLIRVRVYDCNDNLVAEDLTTADGNWFVRGLDPGQQYRVEFDTPRNPELTSSLSGPDNGSDVQFITIGSDPDARECGINYGLTDPALYCQENPFLAMPCYYVGPQDNNQPTLVGIYYNDPQSTSPTVRSLLNDTQTGTTWGLAYQNAERRIYTSTVVRNYMDYGPGGFDAIYATDFSDPDGATGTGPSASAPDVINLEADFGVDLGTDPRTGPITGSSPYFDDAFTGVGKAGMGDIDISSDGDTLFVINLNEARPSVVLLDVSDPDNPALIDDVAIPDPGCSNGDFAPWAAKYYEGKLYIGVTCTAETSQNPSDLSVTVYRYDGGTSFTSIASAPLDYQRGAATYRSNNTFSDATWQPWTDTWDPEQLPLTSGGQRRDLVSQPMPMVQDIEFGDDGSLYLGMGDRFSYMSAFRQREWGTTSGPVYTPVAAGDLLRFCEQGGTFAVEGTAGCPQPVTDRSSIEIPAIPTFTEFFDDNYVNQFNTAAGHAESILGSMTKVPGKRELVTTSFDPIADRGPVNTSGVRFYGEDGQVTKGLVIVSSSAQDNNAKGGSLGDIEALCDPGPIELGNYAWFDLDGDGTQDPCEPPIEGLMVKLYRKNDDGTVTQLATDETDANGNYGFIGDGQDGATWTGAGAGAVVSSTEQYFIAACGDSFNAADSTLVIDGATFCLTVPNTGARNEADLSDSDFTVQTVDGVMIPAYCTEDGETDGTNNSFDIGLKPPPCELDFENLTVDCINDSEFTVTFDLDYDYANATAPGEQLVVQVNGVDVAGSPFTLAQTMGTLAGLEYTSNTPQFGVDVRTFFTVNRDCEISRVIDLVACTDPCSDPAGAGQVGGTVFQDFDNDGTRGANEAGQGNVTVKVYDCNNMLVCETFSNQDGAWSCDLMDGEQYRVEYSTPLLPNLEESFAGPDNGTSVQFVTGGMCGADYGVLDPAEFCNQQDLVLAVSCYETGSLEGGANAGNPAFVSFDEAATGDGQQPQNDATLAEIGSTWGAAHLPETSRVFLGAVLKRHTAVVDGLGFLYELDYTDINSPGLTQSLNLEGVVPQNRPGRPLEFGSVCRGQNRCDTLPGNTGIPGDYSLPSDPTLLSVDLDAFGKVGKVGYGDVDYDQQTGLLWMVNLFERTLLSMDVTAANPLNTINAYEINDAFGIPACPGGEPRPWGLEFNNGLGYLGLVCDAAGSQDIDQLESFVMQFDPAAVDGSFTTLVRIPIQEPSRPDQISIDRYQLGASLPWIDQYEDLPQGLQDSLADNTNFNGSTGIRFAQPILSDIDFTPQGDLIVSMLDRTALQFGHVQYTPESQSTTLVQVQSYGDLFWLCPRGDGGYRKEATGACGPGTTGSPFYNGSDDYFDLQAGDGNQDGALGSHLVLRDGQVAYTVFDPFPPGVDPSTIPFDQNPYVNTQGIHYNSLANGEREDWYQIVERDDSRQNYGKGLGLGDLIALCDAPTAQIGNYVWLDEDEDGIQDACEPPIAGMTVKLFAKPTAPGPASAPELLATTVTDATGNYYFSSESADDPNLDWVGTGADTALVDGQVYFIAFCGDNGYDATGDTLSVMGQRLCITAADVAGADDNPDNSDSDITEIMIGNFGILPAYCTVVGETDTTNHTFDAGFKPVPQYDLALRKTLSPGQAAGFVAGDVVNFDITVINQGDTTAYGITVGDDVSAGLTYGGLAAATPAGTGTITSARGFASDLADNNDQTFTIDSLRANDSIIVTVTTTIDAFATSNAARPLLNRAEIQEFFEDPARTEVGTDEDSTPDADFDNDPGGAPGTDSDNSTNGDGTGAPGDEDADTDEDDADPALVPLFDLALTKLLADPNIDPATITPGTPVPFTINVFNQGADTVTNVVVRDDIPCGYSFDAGANAGVFSTTNPNGASAADAVYANITDLLPPGGGTQLTLQLTFEGLGGCPNPVPDGALVNRAEIESFEDTDGNNPPDFDSTPDAVSGNDAGGLVDSPSDNAVDGDGSGAFGDDMAATDEDDEDPSSLNVFDLAIFKTVDMDFLEGPYVFGDVVKFDIGVVNQGNLEATEIVVQDITPSGLSFDENDPLNQAEGWTANADGATLTITPMPPLGTFDTALVSIYLTVEPAGTDDMPYTNFAEITSGSYDDPNNPGTNVTVTGDGDSPFALGVGNDTGGGVGTDDDNQTLDNRPGEDIDSQDPAFIEVLQNVALGDTTFIDVNMDGLQDDGDVALPNVTVTVFDAETGQPVTTDAFGEPYSNTRVTDANGAYLFDSLPTGNYFVQFDISTAPNGDLYDFTVANAGGDDAIDSDVMPTNPMDDVANSDSTGTIPPGDTLLTLDAGVVCAIQVIVADPFTICSTQDIDLSAGASVAPERLGGQFTTDGTGMFLDANGDEITAGPFLTGDAVTYRPSRADARRGFVTLTLTSNDPANLVPGAPACEPVSNSVRIEILNVDCGEFLWDGN